MPRIPYQFPPPGASDVADEIRQRRPNGELLHLDGMLLNAPQLAQGYNALLKAIRTATTLPDDLKEIAMCRVAVLNGAAYEWRAHAPLAQAAGITSVQLAAIRSESTALSDAVDPNSVLSDAQRATVIYTDWMTKNQMVEMTSTIGAYNMVSRFLVALDVADMADQRVPEV